MPAVTGLGGVFLKSSEDAALRAFFSQGLGMDMESWGRVFPWRDRENPERKGYTVLGMHSPESDYFRPSTLPFMLNFRVDDLDGVLARLAELGVMPVRTFEPEPNGRFVHVSAPGGLTIELWEPVVEDPYDP